MPAGIIGTVGRTTSVTETFQNGMAKPATAQLTSGRSTCGQLPQAWNLLTEVVGCCKTLTGEAFEKLGNVDPVSLKCEDSIEKFKQRIVEVYEPIEDYRIGKIMDSFLDDFTRKHDQEIIDYSLSWAREVYKVEKVAGELKDKWKAHLFFKNEAHVFAKIPSAHWSSRNLHCRGSAESSLDNVSFDEGCIRQKREDE